MSKHIILNDMKGNINYLDTASIKIKTGILKIVQRHNFPQIDKHQIYRETVFLSKLDIDKILKLIVNTNVKN